MTEIVRGDFDGIRIRFYNAEGRLVSSTLAVSGQPLAQNPKFQQETNIGPIPEGEWVISTGIKSTWNPFDNYRIQPREANTGSAWGNFRVALRPLDGTNTYGRTDFYLHGSRDGNGYGSAGCIDVNTADEALFLELIANGASEIPITVKYDGSLRNGFHPVFKGDPKFSRYTVALEAFFPRQDLLDSGYGERFIADGATSEPAAAPDECFLPGTPILLADGTTKPIEAIRPEDSVMTYDDRGNLLPRRVTRVFVSEVAHVLDFHGTGVTPGHVFLCGAGRFADRHVPLLDILRDDGAVVRHDGSLMRAATGCAVGSDADRLIEVVAADGTTGRLRAGTRVAGEAGEVTVSALIAQAGGTICDGRVSLPGASAPQPFAWAGSLPAPEDYVLRQSSLTLAEIYAADEGESPPQMAAALNFGSPTRPRRALRHRVHNFEVESTRACLGTKTDQI